MLVVFKEKKLLIALIIDLFITVAGPFLVFLFCYLAGVKNFVYPFLFAIFAFLNGFLSYFVGDMILVIYKNRNDIVTSGIPTEVILASKHWRYPFIISLITNVIIFAICAIIYASTGSWPLL